MKSLRGRIFYGTALGNSTERCAFFVPAIKGNNGRAVKEIVDFEQNSPTFGARATVGDTVRVKNHPKLAEGVEVTITEIKLFSSVYVSIVGEVSGEGEYGFGFSNLSLPSIF
ncbi:MAG: hypothetical protein PHR36_02255 [Patescibacteria group bacterium]|nr:hypothetical protein [Patescibacteria group bacterium]